MEAPEMADTQIDEVKLKELLKSALVEFLEENRELVRDLLEDALEDIGLKRAIAEAEQTPEVPRAEVFKILQAP
jgi:hypothetical protein